MHKLHLRVTGFASLCKVLVVPHSVTSRAAMALAHDSFPLQLLCQSSSQSSSGKIRMNKIKGNTKWPMPLETNLEHLMDKK
jgi:hypothetical protein